jgi:hypothetical protein
MSAAAKSFFLLALVTTGDLTMADELSPIEVFIFHPDQFGKELIPRRQSPEELVRFIDEHIDRSTPVDALRQTEKVVNFYDLQETASFFEHMLDQREAQPDDVLRSILFTRIVASVGLPPDREFARRYYLFLIPRASTVEMFVELAATYEAIGSTADTTPLVAAIARKAGSIDKSNPQSTHEAADLDRLGNYTLPRAVLLNQEKDRVFNIPGRAVRIEREVDLYLGLRSSYPGMSGYAARRLRREVWAEQPAQQIYRADSNRRREELVAAFRAAIPRVEAGNDLPESAKTIMIRACLRAIDFFGGELSEPEQEQLRQAGRQFNILSNQ